MIFTRLWQSNKKITSSLRLQYGLSNLLFGMRYVGLIAHAHVHVNKHFCDILE